MLIKIVLFSQMIECLKIHSSLKRIEEKSEQVPPILSFIQPQMTVMMTVIATDLDRSFPPSEPAPQHSFGRVWFAARKGGELHSPNF